MTGVQTCALPICSAVAAARAKVDRQSVESVLQRVERLANLGEYNAAAENLADLRLLLHGRLPRPAVKNNKASCPAYGVTLENPDPRKWKLSTQQEGMLQAILLEDKWSVSDEGIMVMILDTAMVYGPEVAQMLQDEENSKETMIYTGRGGAMSAGRIESERFTTIKGSIAYEAIIVPNIPGMKVREQLIQRPGHMLMVLLFGSANNFEDKLAECDRILDEHMVLNDITGNVRLAHEDG